MGRQRRAVITGMGALSPFGRGVVVFWQGLLENRSALRPIRSFDATGFVNAIAGEVADFDPARDLGEDAARRLDRCTQFAMFAVREALTQSGLDVRVDSTATGVILATTLGGMLLGEQYMRAKAEGRPFDARALFHFPYHAVAERVARELGVRGPVVSPSIACASGTQSVGLALEFIRRGQADAFVSGGVETLCPFVVSGFNCLRATTSGTVRPFDAHRDGLLLGEGAAVLIVEEVEHALRRGAQPLAEVAGTGLSGDAVHMTAPARDGQGAARAMQAALIDAGVKPEEIDFISAHGTGTVYNDAMEAAAIASVFGEAVARIPVNGIKGAIGHTLGAAGSFEAIVCVKALNEGVIPPTVGCEELDPAVSLDIARVAPRRGSIEAVLSTSSAFAGNNAAIVLRKFS